MEVSSRKRARHSATAMGLQAAARKTWSLTFSNLENCRFFDENQFCSPRTRFSETSTKYTEFHGFNKGFYALNAGYVQLKLGFQIDNRTISRLIES